MTMVRLGQRWNEILGITTTPKAGPSRLLSILIPSLTERFPLLMRLLWQLQPQLDAYSTEVEVLVLADSRAVPIGTKIDALTAMAAGDYSTVVADDDLVAPTYVARILAAIKTTPKVDAITFEFTLHKKGQGVFRLVEETGAPAPGWVEKAPRVLHAWPSDKAAISTNLRRQLQHEALFDNEDERFARLLHPHLKCVHHIPASLYDIWQDPQTAVDRQRQPK